jgi:hypothetical protein
VDLRELAPIFHSEIDRLLGVAIGIKYAIGQADLLAAEVGGERTPGSRCIRAKRRRRY